MTYTIILFVTRKPTITPDEFKDHWENKHIPLLQSITGSLFPIHVRQYLIRIDRKGFGGPANRNHPLLLLRGTVDDFDYDAIAHLTFESEKAFHQFYHVIYETTAQAQLAADEKRFLDTEKMKTVVVGNTAVSRPHLQAQFIKTFSNCQLGGDIKAPKAFDLPVLSSGSSTPTFKSEWDI
ncbi:hypothetical protein P154DRAFT_517545 [Amniculicola lignicola CBS 123094]|uniref:EthD domain-containing protein n=1 Tax=Amniculicola lignicola CBS 123094 TaxID=1392246 RepID=A0A6A5WZZ4_9PLEO|nr:hypothetical protein P154DRAFT_517545 [Amniculicola lignicola CBS 123094]